MNLTHYPADAFPTTHAAIADRLGNTPIQDSESVVLFGGSARNALLEAVSNVVQPIRDIDLAPIGDGISDEDFWALHQELNPDDPDQNIRIFRFSDIDTLFTGNVDFTINQATLTLGDTMQLTATADAAEAVRERIIQPTAGRIAVTKELQAGGEATHKKFLRNETDMPARAACFVARFRAVGIDFDYNLLDHPQPAAPEDAHPFYLGLMVRKALAIDEIERGPGDITATKYLLDLYREMGLIGKDVPSRTVEHVVAFCEAMNSAKPALKFYDSEVASLVKHTDRAPEPKTD